VMKQEKAGSCTGFCMVIIIRNVSLYFGTVQEEFQRATFFSLFFIASANQDFCDLALGRHSKFCPIRGSAGRSVTRPRTRIGQNTLGPIPHLQESGLLARRFCLPVGKKTSLYRSFKALCSKNPRKWCPAGLLLGIYWLYDPRDFPTSKHQQDVYNEYKHMHALKYSAVKSPDGLIYHLHGPFEGRRNDNALLQNSKLLDRCKIYASDNGFYLYGDAAYPLSHSSISPYDGATPSQEEKAFNSAMGSNFSLSKMFCFWDNLSVTLDSSKDLSFKKFTEDDRYWGSCI
jgi:hypothetical protein